ncbi:MAG: pyridoxal phosphate-dependent aminotransferase [Firmicutes bacterium]|nr:pyridoxal phosphate-dependent aminotransferase [Bacillota bacterium]
MFKKLMNQNALDMHIVSGFEMKQKAKKFEDQGNKVIHLELGEPDFNTPTNITQAGIDAMQRGESHYAQPLGILPLKEEITRYVKKYKGVITNPGNVVVTPGAKPILFYTFLTFVKPGDEVIIPNPGFPIYSVLTKYMGATPVPLKATEDNKFRITLKDLEPLVTSKTKLIILNSPNNPTGSIIEKKEIEAIAEFLRDKDVMVLSDEIYDRLYFGDEKIISMASIPHMKEKTILLDGFSKTYAMTGWRLGYGIMHESIARVFNPLIVASNSCTNTFIQYAGIEAYKGPQDDVETMKAEFKARRDLLVGGLNSIPHVSCVLPDGAFYAFPNFKYFRKDSNEMSNYILENAYISSLPGSTFGEDLDGYVRFSYATSRANLNEALNRLESVLKKVKS